MRARFLGRKMLLAAVAPRRAAAWCACLPALVWAPCVDASPAGPAVKGYETRLFLDEPIVAGQAQVISGGGAPPESGGSWVELWRIPAGGGRAVSLGSARAADGRFTFRDVDVAVGEALYVTLSRSWRFDDEGDLEGWDDTSNDSVLTVEDGVLEIELRNADGDRFLDPWIQTLSSFDPRYYRVVEIRFRNPAPASSNRNLGLFWGSPWPTRRSAKVVEMPAAMTGFQTLQIPMNVDEVRMDPPPAEAGLDGLWDRDGLNNGLRFDPFDGLPRDDFSPEGTVFLIDTIRIREDYRRDFHHHGDLEGLLLTNDTGELAVVGGFLSYVATDVGLNTDPGGDGVVDPYLLSALPGGRLDTDYFTRFAVGMHHERVTTDPLLFGIFFDDEDSAGYRDNGGAGPLQEGNLELPALGRVDAARSMGPLTSGEWTEDGGRVPAQSLRIDCPQGAVEGDRIRIDYFGWIPENPFGPSEPVLVQAIDPPTVTLGFTGPCGEQVEGEGGSLFEETLECVLTTSDNRAGEGASGWSLSIGAQGVSIVAITDEGTAAAEAPAGLRNDGYYKAELTTGPDNEGAVCAVVLSFELPVNLPLEGDVTVARIALEATFPASDGCEPGRVFFADGRQGGGRAVDNVATFLGHSVRPVLGECSFELCTRPGENRWFSYDCNGDGQLDLSDPICHLSFLYLGGREPDCMETLDFNGDGGRDISDPISALGFLFLGRPPHNRGPGCQDYPTCPASPACE